MNELLHESFRLVNFPFTVLLGVMIGYWLLVAFGALDSDFGSDVGGNHDLDVEHHIEGHHAGHHDTGNWWASSLKFINLGDVPVLVVMTFLILSMWTFSLISNRYWTGGSSLFAVAFLFVNLAVSAVVTRYVTMPLKPIFRALNKQVSKPIVLVGKHCKITTTEATGEFGQAEITADGSALLINVRVLNDEVLQRGDVAVIVREDADSRIFFVTANPIPKTDL